MSTTLSHVWKPSHARLVTIDSFIPVPRGSSAAAPPPLNWPTKDPGDILDYILDIGPAIVGNDGDGIATATVSLAPSNPGDLELQSTTADGSRIILWLSGGQAGTVYTITFSHHHNQWPLAAEKRASSCSFAFGSGVSRQRNRYGSWRSVNRSER